VATSSDWLGAFAEADSAAADAPGWLAQLGGGSAFREASPFGVPEQDAPPPPEPDPPEPEADPAAAALACAYADGVAAGRAAAEAKAAERGTRQRALRLNFRALDEAASGVLADDLAATVLALCEGALAGAAIDRDGLLARCHAAARRIGGAAETLALHLHPEDIALMGDDALASWRVTPGPALERGSVLIEGADGSVSDGPAEWRRAIAAAVRG
jgi:flagellar assembly protein FliH